MNRYEFCIKQTLPFREYLLYRTASQQQGFLNQSSGPQCLLVFIPTELPVT
ncbi:UNVERIFIED_CONTAM: hypothetical protein FKN15_048942 [Acipenser sinensis]